MGHFVITMVPLKRGVMHWSIAYLVRAKYDRTLGYEKRHCGLRNLESARFVDQSGYFICKGKVMETDAV